MNEWRAIARTILSACARWSESARSAHAGMYFFSLEAATFCDIFLAVVVKCNLHLLVVSVEHTIWDPVTRSSGQRQAKKFLRACAKYVNSHIPAHAQNLIRTFAFHWNILWFCLRTAKTLIINYHYCYYYHYYYHFIIIIIIIIIETGSSY